MAPIGAGLCVCNVGLEEMLRLLPSSAQRLPQRKWPQISIVLGLSSFSGYTQHLAYG